MKRLCLLERNYLSRLSRYCDCDRSHLQGNGLRYELTVNSEFGCDLIFHLRLQIHNVNRT